MHASKAVHALRRLFRATAVLLLLYAWTNATESRSCGQLLPLPNLDADVIIIGKIIQTRADEHSIDVAIVDSLHGKLLPSDCWQPFGKTVMTRVNTSTLPEDCSGIEDNWSEYIFSLRTSDAHRCPLLAYDGLHRPILPAYSKEERARLRRQSSLCKFDRHEVDCACIMFVVLTLRSVRGVHRQCSQGAQNYYSHAK